VVSNWVFNENLNKVLEKLNCTDQPRHFLFASWEKSLYSEFILSPYKDITTLQKPNIEVCFVIIKHLVGCATFNVRLLYVTNLTCFISE